MEPSDFFIQIPDSGWTMRDEFNSKLAQQLRQGELEDHSDLAAGYVLARLMKSELTAYGTDQSQKLGDEESALALRTLKAVMRRLDVPLDLPFSDFDGWHGYWSAQGMTHDGSWAMRRGYINELFTPVLAKLEELEDSASDTLGFRGVDGEMKNIIFASTSYKPEIVLRDAISNTIEVVSNADTCLVYNRPLTSAGLTWGELVAWWQQEQHLDAATDVEVQQHLFRRLLASLGSPPEELLFRIYCERYVNEDGGKVPALLPQVYLHYDPLTRKQRRALNKPDRLNRERMDFLLMLPSGARVVLEVDGVQHYSFGPDDDRKPSPQLYSEMMAEDRALRLRGYEVFRLGGHELMDDGAPDMLREFFTALDERFGSTQSARPR
jgi:very-short-patch-repair endonuclease